MKHHAVKNQLCLYIFVLLSASCGERKNATTPNRNPAETTSAVVIPDGNVIASVPEDLKAGAHLLTSRDLLKEFRLKGTSLNEEKLRQLLLKSDINAIKNDTTLIWNVAELLAGSYMDEEILNLVKYWPEGLGRFTMVPTFLRELTKQHGIERAEQFYAKLPRNSQADLKTAALASDVLAELLFSHDAAKGISWMESLPEGMDRREARSGILNKIQEDLTTGDRKSLDTALAIVNSDFLAGGLYRMGYEFLSKTDPRGAAAWVLAIDENQPLEADKLVIKESSPVDAISYINKLYEANFNSRADSALASFAKAYADNQPQNALEWLASMPPGPVRDQGIADAAASWSTKNLTAAENWAKNFPDRKVAAMALIPIEIIKHIK